MDSILWKKSCIVETHKRKQRNKNIVMQSENTDWNVFPFNPEGYTNNQNNLENMGETKKVFWKKEQKKPSGLEGRRAAGEPDQNRVESP